MSVENMNVSEFDAEKQLDEAVASNDVSNYLIFLIDDLKLGICADNVVEILTNQPVTYMPMVPHYVRGIFNMRGQIIPVMDIRSRMGKSPSEEDSPLIVLSYENAQIGIFVDGVDQMIEIPHDAIHPMPARSTQVLVSEMCTIPDGSGTMLLLDCAQVFGHG